ncbi:MAG TPA: uroporphyrinogen decarboxylase family protein [Armatimonadota bacterium]|jgi:uroporphyrinogen decarboxylase
MTSRERVLCALRNQTPDRCPVDFGGTAMSLCEGDFLSALRQELGYALPADRDADGTWVDEAIQRYLDVDLRWVPFGPPLTVLRELDPPAYERERAAREQRAATRDRSIKNPAVRHEFPLREQSYAEIRQLQPQPQEPPAHLDWTHGVARAYRAADYPTTFWVSGGFFEAGCAMRGFDQFPMDLVLNPDIVRHLFDVWLAEKLARVELVVKPLADVVDIFCFGDDWGLQTGPFMSPSVFHELIAPYVAEYYAAVHAAAPDSFLFHHSCGSVYRLLEDIIAVGVNVLNPTQPAAAEMQPEALKTKAAGRLCFHGGIDLQHLLPFGTPEEVSAEATRIMRVLGAGGGYLCAAAHSLPEDVPVANLIAMCRAERV